jgi:hypothetical protein
MFMGKVLRNIQLTGAVLIMIATVVAFGVEIKEMVVTKEINLADILLLFIYLEVLGCSKNSFNIPSFYCHHSHCSFNYLAKKRLRGCFFNL